MTSKNARAVRVLEASAAAITGPTTTTEGRSMTLQELAREMFTRMVEAKDASLIDTYYDPDFVLTTNGLTQDLAEFRASHERVYPTAITYRLEYDEDSWVESGDRLAARLWPTRSAIGPRRTITR